MVKKFMSGLFFGAGFTLAAITLYTIWMLYILPPLINQANDSESSQTADSEGYQQFVQTPHFSQMSLNEKIEASTAILILRNEEVKDGYYVSTVDEIIKEVEGIELYYKVGDIFDERPSRARVPRRALVFLTGNPASDVSTSFFNDDKIPQLGGITVDSLKERINGM